MNTIIIIDKSKADKLIAKGYKCNCTKVGKRICYEFFGTSELLAELNKNYSKKDYLTRKTTNF